jgi:hypothetical protein
MPILLRKWGYSRYRIPVPVPLPKFKVEKWKKWKSKGEVRRFTSRVDPLFDHRVEALLGRPYSTAQMTNDPRRLRLKGVIHRIPKTHRYIATSYGLKAAFFSAKLYLRILRNRMAGPAAT